MTFLHKLLENKVCFFSLSVSIHFGSVSLLIAYSLFDQCDLVCRYVRSGIGYRNQSRLV